MPRTHTAKGQKVAGSITSNIPNDEKIRGVKETIKLNTALIHYYELLLLDEPENHLSFQVYLRDIDARAEAIKAERRRLIASYDRGSNGEILSLQRHSEELEEKLKTLRAGLSPKQREKKIERVKVKAKNLREKLIQLERELKEDGFNVDGLMDAL